MSATPKRLDARKWLESHGYWSVAAYIDFVEGQWALAGVRGGRLAGAGARTRRDWWLILAGTPAGLPRVIGGVEFPVIAAARRRQGLPVVAGEVSLGPEEVAPAVVASGRWAARRDRDQDQAFRRRASAWFARHRDAA